MSIASSRAAIVIRRIIGWPIVLVFGLFAWDSARYSMRYFGGTGFRPPPGTTDAAGYLVVPENLFQAVLNFGVAWILAAIAYGGYWIAEKKTSPRESNRRQKVVVREVDRDDSPLDGHRCFVLTHEGRPLAAGPRQKHRPPAPADTARPSSPQVA